MRHQLLTFIPNISWATSALSVVLIVAFSLSTLATDPSHCLTACEPFADEHSIGEVGAAKSTTALSAAQTDDSPAPLCAGASCLCHQSPHASPSSGVIEATSRSLTIPSAPSRPDLGVSRDISHVPRRTA